MATRPQRVQVAYVINTCLSRPVAAPPPLLRGIFPSSSTTTATGFTMVWVPQKTRCLASLWIFFAAVQAARNTSNAGFSTPHDALLPPGKNPDVSFIPALTNLTGRCPPCFNCLLPRFTCGQYGNCDPYDGQCKCPPGWGGIDCLVPRECELIL